MKKNKIAAGALALALGLGAIGPVHAERDVKDLLNRSSKMTSDLNQNTSDIKNKLDELENKAAKDKANENSSDATVEDNSKANGDDNTAAPADKENNSTTDPADTNKKPAEDPADTNKKPADDPADKNKKPAKDPADQKKKPTMDLADNEEKGYDTEADAIAAAKQALADKAYNTAGNNSYEVAKNETSGKWFFKLVIDTDKAIAEENKDDKKVSEGKAKESSSPAKSADHNAKTGVAGLTGVSAILAAATVAFASSKKRD